MPDPKKEVERILKTPFCDILNPEEHEEELRRIVETYLSGFGLKHIADYYKVLSDERRLGILKLLGFRETCVCELTAAIGVSQPNLTYHVKKLENMGLVKSRRQGKWIYYSLVDEDLSKILSNNDTKNQIG